MNELLTVREVAPKLKMSTGRVYELIRTGVLPAARFGKQVRVDPEKLRAFVEAGGQALPSEA